MSEAPRRPVWRGTVFVMTAFAVVCLWIINVSAICNIPDPLASPRTPFWNTAAHAAVAPRAEPQQVREGCREFEQTTTFIAKTMDRPESLLRLLRSIRARWKCARVLVADDGLEAFGEARATSEGANAYIRMSVDAGLSASRNALVDAVRTPFFVLLDDDFEFENRADAAMLVAPLAAGAADIVCGGLYLPVRGRAKQRPRDYFYAGLMAEEQQDVGRTLVLREGTRGDIAGPVGRGGNCSYVDVGINFFAARTDSVRGVRWDDRLKLAEHEDFFLRSRAAGLRVAVCRDVLILHHGDKGGERYAELRKRGRDMWAAALKKHGFDKLVLFNGFWATADGQSGNANASPRRGRQRTRRGNEQGKADI